MWERPREIPPFPLEGWAASLSAVRIVGFKPRHDLETILDCPVSERTNEGWIRLLVSISEAGEILSTGRTTIDKLSRTRPARHR